MRNPFQLFAVVVRLAMLIALVVPVLGLSSANAQSQPLVSYILPAGGQRGTTAEVAVRGRYLIGATGIYISGKGVTGKVVEVTEPDKGKRRPQRLDAAKYPHQARLAVTIAPDAEVGERDLRVITPGGASNRFRFFVGQAPEIVEADESDKLSEEAMVLESLPAVANGQIFQADSDVYRFKATAGQTLVFDVDAQSIIPYIADGVPGWFQPSLRLNDAQGHELAYVDDFQHHPDPLMIYKVPKDGEYAIEIKDVLYRGRSDFVYRLTVGTQPVITHIFPLGGKRNSEVELQLGGINLPQDKLKVTLSADAPDMQFVGGVTSNGMTSNVVRFAAGSYREAFETEPNNLSEQANRVEFPVTVNGRIGSDNDVDHFVFTAKARQALVMEVHAKRLDSPLDSLLTVSNSSGRALRSNDDTIDNSAGHVTQHTDSYVSYTFPSDGDYIVSVADTQGFGGDAYAYRLTISPPEPDYELHIRPDNPRTPQGSMTFFTVTAFRRHGFNSPIDLAVKGLPQGFAALQVTIPEKQTFARVPISAPLTSPIGLYRPKVVGTAVNDRAKADLEAGEKAIKDTLAQVTKLKTAADKAATAHANAAKAAAQRRQQATDATKKANDLAQVQQKAAEAKLAAAVKAARTAEGTAKKAEAAVGPAKAAADKARAAQAAVEQTIPEKQKAIEEAKARLAIPIVRTAVPSEEKMQAFYYMHSIPTKEFLLAVLERGPFALAADLPPGEALKLPARGRVELVIKASFKEGIKPDTITLRPSSIPREWRIEAPPIPAGQNQCTITFTMFGNRFVRAGQRGNLYFTASMKVGKQTVSGFVPAIPYEIH